MFEPGQKVSCVDASGAPELIEGRVYTVAAMNPETLCVWRGRMRFAPSVLLAEVQTGEGWRGYAMERFRPFKGRLASTETGFAVIEEIRRKATRQKVRTT